MSVYIGPRAVVRGTAVVGGNAYVGGNAFVGGNAYVGVNAYVGGNAYVRGNADVRGNARVERTQDHLVLGPIGSEDQFITLWREANGGHGLSVGCWTNHKVDELAAEVQRRAPQCAAEYAAAEVLIRARIATWEADGRD